MTTIIHQMEEMKQKEKLAAVKAGPCFTHLREGSVMETRTWVKNVGFTTRAMLGAREPDRGCAEREVGRGARRLKTIERRGINYPRKTTRPKSRFMKRSGR